MPKSKRARVVHTSKTTKKGKPLQQKTHSQIQECLPQYPYLYILTFSNMRNEHLQEVRSQLTASRLFFGKVKVMLHALLNLPPELASSSLNLSSITPHLSGESALLFSNSPPLEIQTFLSSFSPLSYARAGNIATQTFILPAGRLYSLGGQVSPEDDVPITVQQEPNLRKIGLPTSVVKGKVELENDFEVCKEGEALGSGQTTLLKAFGVQMAEFEVRVKCWWERETGKVQVIQGEEGILDGVEE